MKKLNVTQRERRVLMLAGVCVILALVYFGVAAVYNSYDALEKNIKTERDRYLKLSHLREQYLETHERLEEIRSRLSQTDKGFSLVSFIEDLATQQDIRNNMGAAKQKTLPLGEEYKEDLVEIQLDDITLSKLVDFIHKIENSGHLLRVKRLKVKTRYDNRNLLSVTMSVTTYSKKG